MHNSPHTHTHTHTQMQHPQNQIKFETKCKNGLFDLMHWWLITRAQT